MTDLIRRFLKGYCLWLSGAFSTLTVVSLLVSKTFEPLFASTCLSVMFMGFALFGFEKGTEEARP